MHRILFVCYGNICRSTMAEYVMKDLVQKAGQAHEFYIDSAGTSDEELGNGVYYLTRRKLEEEGVPCGNHRARQMTRRDYEGFDLLIGMEQSNLQAMRWIVGGDPEGKIHALLDYTDRPGPIADPWYTRDFDSTYRDVLEGCQGLLEDLKK